MVPAKKASYAIGDEVGCVLASDDALSKSAAGEAFNKLDDRGVSVLSRDQFQQVQIARGIEEMCSKEIPVELGCEALRNLL
jgi:hypothetical protein